MSDFKKKLLQEVVNPAKESSRVGILTGVVVESRNSNSCKVDFSDKDGNSYKNKKLRIRTYDDSMWCPNEGDTVLIEQNKNEYEVVGKFVDDWESQKKSMELTADVYTNYTIDNMPGSIY